MMTKKKNINFNKRFNEVNIKLYYIKEDGLFAAECAELPTLKAFDECPAKALITLGEFYSDFLGCEEIDKIHPCAKRRIINER